uniref:Uncharacterized protein n=1 Tax=Oryza sativa subsp. japonica TaxID=39947 RepID=Q69VE4_ORYSJ|nr:hypothetical protein [Oryza sativa Japonica Group]
MANENEVDTSNNVKDKDEEDGDRGSWQTWVLAQERKAQGQRVEGQICEKKSTASSIKKRRWYILTVCAA